MIFIVLFNFLILYCLFYRHIEKERQLRNVSIVKELNSLQVEIIRKKHHVSTDSLYCFKENVKLYDAILWYKPATKHISQDLKSMKKKMEEFLNVLKNLENIVCIHNTIMEFI